MKIKKLVPLVIAIALFAASMFFINTDNMAQGGEGIKGTAQRIKTVEDFLNATDMGAITDNEENNSVTYRIYSYKDNHYELLGRDNSYNGTVATARKESVESTIFVTSDKVLIEISATSQGERDQMESFSDYYSSGYTITKYGDIERLRASLLITKEDEDYAFIKFDEYTSSDSDSGIQIRPEYIGKWIKTSYVDAIEIFDYYTTNISYFNTVRSIIETAIDGGIVDMAAEEININTETYKSMMEEKGTSFGSYDEYDIEMTVSMDKGKGANVEMYRNTAYITQNSYNSTTSRTVNNDDIRVSVENYGNTEITIKFESPIVVENGTEFDALFIEKRKESGENE